MKDVMKVAPELYAESFMLVGINGVPAVKREIVSVNNPYYMESVHLYKARWYHGVRPSSYIRTEVFYYAIFYISPECAAGEK